MPMSFKTYLEALNAEIEDIKPIKVSGRVVSVKGLVIECRGINEFVSIGSRCRVNNMIRKSHVLCEVVGFENESVLLMPFDDTEGIGSGAEVEVYQHENTIHPDASWLGRIINAFAEPIVTQFCWAQSTASRSPCRVSLCNILA